jgi:hypothetical protein
MSEIGDVIRDWGHSGAVSCPLLTPKFVAVWCRCGGKWCEPLPLLLRSHQWQHSRKPNQPILASQIRVKTVDSAGSALFLRATNPHSYTSALGMTQFRARVAPSPSLGLLCSVTGFGGRNCQNEINGTLE